MVVGPTVTVAVLSEILGDQDHVGEITGPILNLRTGRPDTIVPVKLLQTLVKVATFVKPKVALKEVILVFKSGD